MSRRGNPSDNAKTERVKKTLKAEAVYLRNGETFEDITVDLSPLPRRGLQSSEAPLRARLSQSGAA
jgi:transposase InsO family protein